MIPLGVMAVGDQRDDPARAQPRAAQVVDRWPHDAGTLDVFRYSANFVYTVDVAGERHFLRVAAGSERTRDRIEREAALLGWLREQGWAVPAPVPSRRGGRVATHAIRATHASGDTDASVYHAMLFSAVPGQERVIETLAPTEFAAWGAALGRLHPDLARVPPAGPVRAAWRDELALITAALPRWPAPVGAVAARIIDQVTSLPRTSTDYGLIHGDFELDNLLWAGETLGVLDFDEAGYSWYAADLAFALRDLFDPGATLADDHVQAFLAGYATARPLPPDLAVTLPLFSQWARLASAARITRALDQPATALPRWAADLHDRLARMQTELLTRVASATDE